MRSIESITPVGEALVFGEGDMGVCVDALGAATTLTASGVAVASVPACTSSHSSSCVRSVQVGEVLIRDAPACGLAILGGGRAVGGGWYASIWLEQKRTDNAWRSSSMWNQRWDTAAAILIQFEVGHRCCSAKRGFFFCRLHRFSADTDTHTHGRCCLPGSPAGWTSQYDVALEITRRPLGGGGVGATDATGVSGAFFAYVGAAEGARPRPRRTAACSLAREGGGRFCGHRLSRRGGKAREAALAK